MEKREKLQSSSSLFSPYSKGLKMIIFQFYYFLPPRSIVFLIFNQFSIGLLDGPKLTLTTTILSEITS